MLDEERLAEWTRVSAIEFATEASVSYVCANIEKFDVFSATSPHLLEWDIDCCGDETYERICMANLLLGAV